jgi:NTP pyrophosphatase (non-canonical NTP hydrolase)
MTYEMSDFILGNGKQAALQKMTQDKNLSKPDMRTLAFSELYLLLKEEVSELHEEILNSFNRPMTPELLQAIQDEAGDVIAFASGIVSKAIQVTNNLNYPPSLFNALDWL